jgi:non-homologous end joining protein Ku
MLKQDGEFDYDRYQRLLADAVDEKKRRALIDLLIEERARDRLAALRASDRAAMTATTIARVLGSPRA